MQRVFVLAILAAQLVLLPSKSHAVEANSHKYKCFIGFPKDGKTHEIAIPLDEKSGSGTIEFDYRGIHKVSAGYYGDAVRIDLYAKSSRGNKTIWNNLGGSRTPGDVRSAMLIGPEGLFSTCTKSK